MSALFEAITTFNPWLATILLTLIPTLELRASIPFALLAGLGFWGVLLAYGTNIVLGLLLFPVLDFITKFLLRFKWINKLYQKIVIKPRKKIESAVRRFGEWGLALFIAVPLPGSGVYTGAIGAYLLGIKVKDYYLAVFIGVTLAAIVVSIITLIGMGLF